MHCSKKTCKANAPKKRNYDVLQLPRLPLTCRTLRACEATSARAIVGHLVRHSARPSVLTGCVRARVVMVCTHTHTHTQGIIGRYWTILPKGTLQLKTDAFSTEVSTLLFKKMPMVSEEGILCCLRRDFAAEVSQLVSWCFEPSQPQGITYKGWKQTSI